MAETWVIEYLGTPACWISEPNGNVMAFDVTFQRKLAHRFQNREDCTHEILRLGLSGQWSAIQLGKSEKEKS